jgi:Transglycosylase-like domain
MANTKYNLSNWSPGKVTLFQALGLKGATYPAFAPRLLAGATINNPGPAGAGQTSTTGAANAGGTQSGGAGPLGGTSGINGCTAAQTAANQKLGQQLATSYGWGSGSEWSALNSLVMSESGWCNLAQNPTSTAYGIGQFLNTTWASVGGTKTSSAQTQIQLMLLYIKQRYGTPSAAWAFHQANNWY